MRVATVAIALVAVVLAAGCETFKKTVTREKRAPDEFAVYSRAPLSVPPEFALRPPEPGAERPQAVSAKESAQDALFTTTRAGKGGARPKPQPLPPGLANASPGVQALLRNTGALSADPSIRTLVNRETSILAEDDKTLADRIMFWGVPNEHGQAVDPQKESQRIRETQALGKPITEGDTPVITRKRRAILEDLF